MNPTLAERLRSWAQNEEMVNQYFTEHGRDCNEAAAVLDDLLAALEVAEGLLDSFVKYAPPEGKDAVAEAHLMVLRAIAKGQQ